MKIFVSSPVNVAYDRDAEPLLAQTNDSRFATERGILKVDDERWQQAQRYERDTWLEYNLGAVSDRNEEHNVGFAQYQSLPQDLGDYIELGCGPFTNSRFIVGGRTLRSLTLLDPLIEDYEREHPHCGYKGWQMGGHQVTPVYDVIENWQPGKLFDTVVMTNVLSHCYDALAVFDTVRRILRRGGYFVFHEDPRPFEPMDLYDVGHPLVVTQAVIDEFLAEFDEVFRQGKYFIGRKPGLGEAVLPIEAVKEPEPEPTRGELQVEIPDLEFATVAEPPKKRGRRK